MTTQAADTDLISETLSLPENEGRWTSAHRLRNIAYLYVRFRYNQDAFPNGILSETHMLHTRRSGCLTPINATLVVIIYRRGMNIMGEADIKAAEANGEDFLGAFVGGTYFSFT